MRVPFQSNNIELFRHEMWLLGTLLNVFDDADISGAMEVLDEALLRKISGNITRKAMTTTHRDVRKFWQMFKERYFNLFDTDYTPEWNGKYEKMAVHLVERLSVDAFTVEDYVNWLFDEFFPSNRKLGATHQMALSVNIMQQFLQQNADKIKAKRAQSKLKAREQMLLNKAAAMYREQQDPAIYSLLQEYQKGIKSIGEFDVEICKIERMRKAQ